MAARGLKEAEPELEKLSRSGYRTVVTFARRGEGERFGYNLGRLKVNWLGEDAAAGGPPVAGCRPAFALAQARLSRASSRRSSIWR